jgi:hypothetical protein
MRPHDWPGASAARTSSYQDRQAATQTTTSHDVRKGADGRHRDRACLLDSLSVYTTTGDDDEFSMDFPIPGHGVKFGPSS